ncbi:MAG: cyclopropane fatty acyl phospholipid synthase [Burkholderiales bacterium]
MSNDTGELRAAATEARAPGTISRLLGLAGIQLNGPAPSDILVRDPSMFDSLLAGWSLGLGESYVEEKWECERIDELACRLLRADLDGRPHGLSRLRLWTDVLRAKLVNLQSRRRAFQVGERHYDIGDEVFEAMLDANMVYSCAYWDRAVSLDDAQLRKLDMICRKLELKPGEHLLDIGCGWGALAAYAARHFGVKVTGVTVSRNQEKAARERCAGLPVEIALMDYRDLSGSFDKVVSVGMFEHVGARNYRAFLQVVDRVLERDGLFLLHTIGSHVTLKATDAWIDRYIFPNGAIPSAPQLTAALEGLFLVEDWHNFGPDYDRTLMAWHANFERAWPRLAGKYPERFRRMWRYYLLSCAGYFRSRQGQLWQLVLARRGRRGTYRSYRPAPLHE